MPGTKDIGRRRKQEKIRRSPCPVACALDLLGDRWTLLVVRDLFLGRSRFKDFLVSPEGIPTNILSDRLARLLEHGVVEQIPAADGTKRLAYRLTRKGKSLAPLLQGLKDWGLKWEKGTRVALQAHPS
ncbi:MAG: helix-turn-helix domain-containing protein [Candidatus Methylacidiphilales bacterium]|nr:helix-turn-helix domain-containing protein [Candidatus Methylacidiphilales bacterium]